MYAVGANAALAALPARRRRSCAASVQKKARRHEGIAPIRRQAPTNQP
ncbi:hypothetical protein C7S16_4134 [Burkholderia thailandensis]|uniref:Uncharacterized protein n=1 Tax=Burkholderia thailandensis TaxID=57975 RepID=A0AAW9D6R5_BURTH|nr:hypothetical protein [Burkholderia thailandensis]